MQLKKEYINLIPEIVLIIAVISICIGESSVGLWSIFALLTLVYLLISQSKVIGILTSGLTGIIALGFLLAVVSGFHKIPVNSSSKWEFFAGGFGLFFMLMTISIWLFAKYTSTPDRAY